MPEMQVNPWEVKGDIDYDKLVQEFGVQKISPNLIEKLSKKNKLHPLLKRNFYFAHRDLDLILQDAEKKKPFYLYTGRAPSGAMHLGHLFSFMMTKWLQESFNVNAYIQIPDEEKFLAKKELSLQEIDKWSEDNILEIIALGFDPDKTFVFQDREFAGKMFEPAVKIAKKITFSTAKAVFGFNNETNIGWIFYPAMQNVPCFFEKNRCLIPCALDQDPYWRIQRDIAESFGYYKTATILSKFFPPLTGVKGKMSSSEQGESILLTDSEEAVKNKINKYAFSGGQATSEEQKQKGANLEVDVSFQWLNMFFEEDDKKIKEIGEAYSSGAMLTGEIKQILIKKINAFLSKHQLAKRKAKKQLNEFKYSGKLAKKMWKTEIMK